MEGRKGSCCRIIWPLSAHPSSTTTPSNCLPTRSSMPSSTEKHRFYAPPDQIAGDVAVFTEEESRHVIKVLRLGVGDVVTVVNGDGLTCRAELEMISKRSVLARILERKEEVGEPSFDLHIGLSVLNQPTRWETFLEKAVENGCTRITPLVSQRTQKVKFNRRRLESILVSALKQSERSRLPVLDDPTSFESLMKEFSREAESDQFVKLICHESRPDGVRLGHLLSQVPAQAQLDGDSKSKTALEHPKQKWSVLVGPEGGFSEEEVERAVSSGWKSVWLGERRLRAETAAMTVISVISQSLDERQNG